ncbi:MAG: tetratricopeptide repeat protein [Candidatus Aminicenantales bacterium]
MPSFHVIGRKKRTIPFLPSVFFFFFVLVFLTSCVNHLREAKSSYAQGQKYARSFKQEKAISSFRRALEEARYEAEKNPSAQAFLVKGLAELELGLWREAEESFRLAFAHGFEKGEEWAQQLSLLGLASSFEESGLEDAAFKIYSHLLLKSKFRPILLAVSQKYTDMAVKRALEKEGKERQKALTQILATIEKLVRQDMSNGFYHYLLSQILGQLSRFRQSFEEAVMARELGLPTEKIFRDNDLQIVFCYRMLKENLPSEEWEKFSSSYIRWTERWKWKGPETPGWKR